MAVIQKFSLVLAALLAASVTGQTNLQFDNCELSASDESDRKEGSGFGTDREGSQRRTYGNLCAGTKADGTSGSSDDVGSRIGHPFNKFCNLIDRYPNVQALMATGNSPHTIFAPTDAAFAKVDGLLNRVDEQRLLELHILPQARLTRDLRCGQTYRTINTQQDRRNNQRSKTRCVSADRSQQIGPGNTVNGLKPTIGQPPNIFTRKEFEGQTFFDLIFNDGASSDEQETFSQDVISCNGVIHVVDEILLPGGPQAFAGGAPPYYGPVVPGSYYGGINAYNGGIVHSHGPGGGQGGYYGGYYGAGAGGYYYGPRPPPRPSYYRGFKGGKGGKGSKGYNYGRLPPPRPVPFNYYNGFRKLTSQDKADSEPDEKFMTDAEFFGVGAHGLNNPKAENKEDTPDRKRRLEALLEPDGTIEV